MMRKLVNIPGKEEVVKEITRLAEENGIKVLVFKTAEEMNELLDDMRTGARVKAVYRDYGFKRPKEYLM